MGQLDVQLDVLGVTWSAAGASGFLWREFGSVSVLFDPRSGETHMLDSLAREILDLFIEQPRAASDVARALEDLIGGPGDEISLRVDQAIAEFDRLGLIFPAALR